MTTALDLINAIESGKTLECEQVFADLVQSKVEAAIAARADEIRASMFESEQLDELSKGTLGSYAKKASASAAGLATTAMHHKATEKQWRDRGEDEKADEFSKHSFGATEKQIKRQQGVGKAVSRLTKESAELDEAVRVMSTNPAGGGMVRFPKNHPSGAAAQSHRDATAKLVKQARSTGITLKKHSTERVGGANVMKYSSKNVKKESTELDEGAKHVTFSGKDANKNPVNVHVGTDAQGNKYHVVSGNPGTNHHPSKVFSGSHSEAEKKMSDVAGMVHSGKHDEALAHLNKTSHITFSKED